MFGSFTNTHTGRYSRKAGILETETGDILYNQKQKIVRWTFRGLVSTKNAAITIVLTLHIDSILKQPI